jgi:hypothetical protein
VDVPGLAVTSRGGQYPDGPLEPTSGERFLPLPRGGYAQVFAGGTDPNGVPWCPVDAPPAYAELEALSAVIMRAESDDAHWPFRVRDLPPFELARAILKAGYRRDPDVTPDA